MEFTIPYEFEGMKHHYTPDFVAAVSDEPQRLTLIVELKGRETEQDRQKHQAARRWCSAVNNWGRLGRWEFHVCRSQHMVSQELRALIANIQDAAASTADRGVPTGLPV